MGPSGGLPTPDTRLLLSAREFHSVLAHHVVVQVLESVGVRRAAGDGAADGKGFDIVDEPTLR
jgi:hypothetical protein